MLTFVFPGEEEDRQDTMNFSSACISIRKRVCGIKNDFLLEKTFYGPMYNVYIESMVPEILGYNNENL